MNALNLVLLGLPSSGKSTLLGSLQEAAQAKGTKLGGSLVDLSGELAKLRERSKSDKYIPTKDAVTVYPIQRHTAAGDETIAIHDTSGAQTAAALAGESKATGPLPKTLADADGVVLVVDASASPAELEQQFKQMTAFFDRWQMRRSMAAAVGGLPVFLVLAQCDKIARKGETVGQWMQRIEEAKRRVGEQFQTALADSRDLPFGRIDVRVWATSAKRPAADKPARADEPYQVAELFQQIFDAAAAFRQRSELSRQTLHWALVGLGGVATLLLLLAGWYFATRPTPEEAALDNRVQTLLAGGENNIAERVREPLDDRIKELREVKANAAYDRLPAATRQRVEQTEKAIEDYQRLNVEFQKEVRNPRLATRQDDLDQIEKSLEAYAEKVRQWPVTRLEKRHYEWTGDATAIRQAIHDEVAWTRMQIDAGEKLRAAGGLVIAKKASPAERESWFKDVHEYLVCGRRHKSNDRVEGTTVPYRVIYQFDTVAAAERDWRQFKERLDKIREEAREK